MSSPTKAILCWILSISVCDGFNIERSETSLKYYRSFTVEASLSKAGSKESESTKSREEPATFIHHILETKSSLTETEARGDILSCSVETLFSSQQANTSCTSVSPPWSKLGDLFGLEANAAPDGRYLACSPVKDANCISVNYNPGYCYKSSNAGSSWIADQTTNITACPTFSLDLIFLLDGSASVGPTNFNLVKNWTKAVARNFDISDGSTQLGVIQYSHYFRDYALDNQPYIFTEISLGKYKDQAKFEDAIDNVTLQAYSTYTAHALNKSVLDFKESKRFTQESTKKVLILLTDGRSNDFAQLTSSANYVRSLGITTFSVGVGGAKPKELRIAANGDTSDNGVYYVSDFSDLNKIINQLRKAIVTFALEGSQGNSSTTTYNLELAELGFSSHYSTNKCPSYTRLVWCLYIPLHMGNTCKACFSTSAFY